MRLAAFRVLVGESSKDLLSLVVVVAVVVVVVFAIVQVFGYL